jgi:hypothetical protein
MFLLWLKKVWPALLYSHTRSTGATKQNEKGGNIASDLLEGLDRNISK